MLTLIHTLRRYFSLPATDKPHKLRDPWDKFALQVRILTQFN
eukprot:UN02458